MLSYLCYGKDPGESILGGECDNMDNMVIALGFFLGTLGVVSAAGGLSPSRGPQIQPAPRGVRFSW